MIKLVALRISTDKSEIDLTRLMAWLGESYWASARDAEIQQRAIDGSLCFSAFDGDQFVGFARVVTDYATFAWVCDVIVSPEHRGLGIGKSLMDAIRAYPDFQSIRMVLATRDAHELYRRYGFVELGFPQNWMAIGFRTCETPECA